VTRSRSSEQQESIVSPRDNTGRFLVVESPDIIREEIYAGPGPPPSPDHLGSLLGVGELQVQVFYTTVGASHHSNILFKSKIFFLMIVERELMVREDVTTGTNSM